ncbi:hypothetical protein BDFB_005856 [Asbolus verrucosus]|uniref:Ig-like domain-containing protein n=1 Tax=Asbolus verrucosus TaxID=1661398 RepID=A0A482W4C1_ASBVE|nr:hypothetical protein BDFB_005856 [Asbolus verrucosus]
MNTEKWDDYYACLATQNTSLGHDFSVTPEAIQAAESSSLSLECKLCLSPQETTKLDSVQWYWAGHQNTKLEPIEYGENILISPIDKALQMYNLHEKHTGQYICRMGQAEAPPYFLTVVASLDEDLNEVHSAEAPSGPYAQQPEEINGYNLIVDTEWTPWTSCSKCNQIGRRHRFGYCIVKYKKKHGRHVRNNNGTSENIKTPTVQIPKEHYELLQIFKFGIPCSSHILPRSLKKINEVVNRKNEIMSGYCKGLKQ